MKFERIMYPTIFSTSRMIVFAIVFLSQLQIHLRAQEVNAEVVDYKSVCVFDKSKLSQSKSVTVQVNNRAGEEYGEVKIYYSKADKLTDVSVRLEDRNGILIRTLGKNELSDRSAISEGALYEDSYVKQALVKHNVYPYRVTYSYTIVSKNYIEIADWTPVVYNDIPTRNATLKVVIPKNVKFEVTTMSVDTCQKDSTVSSLEMVWKSRYNKQIKNEVFAEKENFYPRVIVVPGVFNYGVEGESRSWTSLGKWYANLTRGLDNLPDEEKTKVQHLISGLKDKRDIIRKLYRYLQDNTRYINISIGIGGLKPYPASYVAQNRYGDCKALTTYMKALLKAAGIDSKYVLIYAGDQPRSLIRQAVFPQFNHVILAVPVDRDTIWLENTSPVNPFGYMGLFTQNREALLVDEQESHLVHVPALHRQDAVNERMFNFRFSSAGHATVNWSSIFKGQDFDRFTQINTSLNEELKDRIIRDYIPFKNYEVLDWHIERADRDSSFIKFNASFNVYKYLKSLGTDMYFSLYPVEIPNFIQPALRTLPLEIPYPVGGVDSLVYYYPDKYGLKGMMKDVNIDTKFGTYSCVFHPDKEKLLVIKKINIYAGRYSLSQYSEFYEFIKYIKEIDTANVLLQRAD
ncbi:DUF3857 domain-containing transglutaminase family protein [Paludibacter jiangxiensis]|uniref:Transglutaminase-like enzyme n=1 Tax=Paludibacter jiangxiensis TaxID=681398 RepID=A0A161LEC8_9BACT|nr:DUF3857 and transglutaminase domain-containing protein [Paludibacter jiangxiensis]GAT62577.1 transglutaminase-like enzyme [Paludibacter jiangxiensis]